MIVALEIAERTFYLDVVAYRDEVEMPDRAECGTTLASIIALCAREEDLFLEEAERRITERCARAYEDKRADMNDGGDY